ncbi:hypothetical protein TrRE_jg8908 [Triparma retinervis]|uniref:Sulfatase N-terminal domain-containing protein n=1 Tax=Triparma retinervis TaxID=2557542 RepID=A0A9W7AX12_9STRA|nr:hypothetical protein TrRE_jg8908 [Triparma retinervis]
MSHYVLVHGQDYCLPPDPPTLPELLPPRFRKHHVGKWHLGHSRPGCLPTSRGYDDFQGYYLGGVDFYRHGSDEACCCGEVCGPGRSFGSFNGTFQDVHGLQVGEGEYITDAITRAAVSTIEGFEASPPPGGPASLFLTVAMAATHSGPSGDPQYKPSDVDPDLLLRSPKRAGFSAMAKNLDESVEAIHAALEGRGMLEDTLIFLLSDNGGETSSGSSVYPLRGEKFTYFNGGIMAPAAVLGKGVKGGGRSLRGNFWIGDVMPTVLEAVGAAVPGGLDGISRSGAVFYGRFKLLVNGTAGYDEALGRPELAGWSPPADADDSEVRFGPVEEVMLFDVRDDEEERVNLAGLKGYAEVQRRCMEEFNAVLESTIPLERQTKQRGGSLDEITPGDTGYGPWQT